MRLWESSIPACFVVSGYLGFLVVSVLYPWGLISAGLGILVGAVAIVRAVQDRDEDGGRGRYYVCAGVFVAVVSGYVIGAYLGYPAVHALEMD